jgi:hypothetical protein
MVFPTRVVDFVAEEPLLTRGGNKNFEMVAERD